MGSASAVRMLLSGLMCLTLNILTWTPANCVALRLNQANQLDSLLGGYGGLTLEPHTDPVNVSNYVDTLSSVPDYIFDNAALIASMDSDDFHRDLYSGHRGVRSQTASSSTLSSSGLFNSINALDDMSEYVLPKQYTPSKPSSYINNNNHKNNYNNKKNHHHGVPIPPSPGNLVHIITNVVPQMKGRASSQYSQPPTSHGGSGGEIDMEMIRNILSQVLKHLEDQSTVIAKGKRRSQPSSSSSYSSDQQRGTPSINDLQYRPVGPSRANQHHHHHTHSPIHSGTVTPSKNFKPVSSGRRPKPYLQDMSGIVGEDGMIAIPLPPNVVRLNFLPKNKPHKRRPCKDDDEFKRKSSY